MPETAIFGPDGVFRIHNYLGREPSPSCSRAYRTTGDASLVGKPISVRAHAKRSQLLEDAVGGPVGKPVSAPAEALVAVTLNLPAVLPVGPVFQRPLEYEMGLSGYNVHQVPW